LINKNRINERNFCPKFKKHMIIQKKRFDRISLEYINPNHYPFQN
jgi:hypothetical protein